MSQNLTLGPPHYKAKTPNTPHLIRLEPQTRLMVVQPKHDGFHPFRMKIYFQVSFHPFRPSNETNRNLFSLLQTEILFEIISFFSTEIFSTFSTKIFRPFRAEMIRNQFAFSTEIISSFSTEIFSTFSTGNEPKLIHLFALEIISSFSKITRNEFTFSTEIISSFSTENPFQPK